MDTRVHCMVCCKNFRCAASTESNTYTNQVLSRIFETLFKTLGVVVSENDWNFGVDPFPFCKNCRNQVAKLCQLSQDLERINKKINKVVANITCAVVESTESKASWSSKEVQIHNNYDRPTSSKRLHNIQVEKKITHYRDKIKQRFAPHVPLKNDHELRSTTTTEVQAAPNLSFNLMEYFDGSDDFIQSEVDNLNDSCEPFGGIKVQVQNITPMIGTINNNVIEVTTSETMMKRDMLQRPMRSMTKLPNGNIAYEGFEVQPYADGGARCLTCGLEFTKKSKRKYMMEHLRIVHVKESGKFQCHICGKQFNTKPHLKQHERTHLEVRAFQCTVCSHTYKTAVERNRHMKRHYVVHNNNETDEAPLNELCSPP